MRLVLVLNMLSSLNKDIIIIIIIIEVQCRVDFHSVTSDPRVHARGWG